MRLLSSPLLVFLLATGASAADATRASDAVARNLQACLASNMSTIGMKGCLGTALSAADAQLNGAYARITRSLHGSSDRDEASNEAEILRRLTAAERAWVTFRDAECAFKGTDMLGGSGEGLSILQCEYDLTSARAAELDAFERDSLSP